MSVYALLIGLIALATIGTIAGFALAQVRAGRKHWARYKPPEGAGKFVPVLCPHCRQRSYSARANRERVCPNCHRAY